MARRTEPRGQVLVLLAIMLVVLLGFAGVSVDLGRQNAERRHVQTAADAAALAACRALTQGASDAAAASEARTVAEINLQGSPAAASAYIAADNARDYDDGYAGDPEHLVSGIIVSGTSVRVAIYSQLDTTLARAVGVPKLETSARARCQLQGKPSVPIVARRYANAPGPGGGFVDFLATEATSADGQLDAYSVLGYDTRTPASELYPGPQFELYGPGAKASNESGFRGFVALDVRNFESVVSRVYYNGVAAGTTENTLKNMEGEYLISGYNGPGFPPITSPADPNDQVAALIGNDTAMVVNNFDRSFDVGDRVLLAVYNGTVMQIPDFSITPPSVIELPGTTTTPQDGPAFVVSRNDAFTSTVTLHLHGDAAAVAAGHPETDIIPDPPVSPPATGQMNQPTWSTDVFVPDKKGTKVETSNLQTNAVPAGIYTVWLEGHSGNPYYAKRRYAVPVRIGGAVRDFSFANSTTSGSAVTVGETISVPLYVSTTSASTTKWNSTNQVELSIDESSYGDCSLNAKTFPTGQISLDTTSVTPTSSGDGALSTLSIDTTGMSPGCYRFDVRGYGLNGDGQPVMHVQPVTFTVATTATNGAYVDIIGFAVFEITDVNANAISGRAITGVAASSEDQALRAAQQPRLIPW